MQCRGPFFDPQNSRSQARGTHTKWEDDEPLPFTNRPFGGADAGRKSRDKLKKEMMARAMSDAQNEEDGWFDKRRGGGDECRLVIRI